MSHDRQMCTHMCRAEVRWWSEVVNLSALFTSQCRTVSVGTWTSAAVTAWRSSTADWTVWTSTMSHALCCLTSHCHVRCWWCTVSVSLSGITWWCTVRVLLSWHYLVVYRECVIIVGTVSVWLSWHYLVVYHECVIIVALSGGVLWVCHYHGITSWCTVSVSVSWHYLVVYRECVIIMALPRGVPWVCHYHSITWWCTVSVLLSWHYLVFTAAVNRQSFTWKKY